MLSDCDDTARRRRALEVERDDADEPAQVCDGGSNSDHVRETGGGDGVDAAAAGISRGRARGVRSGSYGDGVSSLDLGGGAERR